MKGENLKELENKQLNKSKISLQECKAILNKNGENFSDEDVKSIRDFLYSLIEIDYFHFQKCLKVKTEQEINFESDTDGKILQLNERNDLNELRQTG